MFFVNYLIIPFFWAKPKTLCFELDDSVVLPVISPVLSF